MNISRSAEGSLLAVMLLGFLLVSLLLLPRKGLFIDDSMHMPAGYSYLLTHDYRLNQEHPPLIKLLSGLGVWKLHPRFPFESPGWQQATTPEDPEDGMVKIEEAFFAANAPQFEQLAFYGRLPVLIVPLLLLVAVWWFTRELFGPVAALSATFLLATEPNIAGNSIVVQNDIASALALLLFVIAARRFLSTGSLSRALVLGVTLGIALVTKYSLVVLAPVSFAITIACLIGRWRKDRSALLSLALSVFSVFVVAYVILIAFYAFHVDKVDANESAAIAGWFYLTGNTAELFKKILMWLPPLVPRYFVYGIDMVVQDTREGRPTFLLGNVSDTGWWYYFPVVFALKTTIPFLLSSICGFVWAVVQIVKHKRYVLFYVVLPASIYLALAMTSHLNIGVRHLLPMFPFIAITGGAFVTAVVNFICARSRRFGIVFAMVGLLTVLIIFITTFPNYLTYTSPFAGGPERAAHKLSDSNLETGQEVKPLAQYLKARGQNRVTGIMVGGEFLRFYGVQLADFPGWESDDDDDSDDDAEPEPIETEYVAIGAWYMTEADLSDEQKQIIDVYRQQTPEAIVGNSIFVFRRR